jgi:hypothetical protein
MMWTMLSVAFAADPVAACDRKLLADALLAPPQKAEDVLHWAAATLTSSCTLPRGVGVALPQLAPLKPDQRRQVDLQTASDEPRLLAWACPAGPGVAVDVSFAKTQAAARSLVFKQCDLGRYGWFTEPEFAGAQGGLVSTVLVAHVLRTDGVDDASARALTRAVLGLFDPPAPASPPPP